MVNAAPRARADRRELSALCVQETAGKARGKGKKKVSEKSKVFSIFEKNTGTNPQYRYHPLEP
jgi:hypothetical protein